MACNNTTRSHIYIRPIFHGFLTSEQPVIRNSSKNGTALNLYEDVVKRVQISIILLLNITVVVLLFGTKLRANHSTKLFLNLQITHIMIALSVLTFGEKSVNTSRRFNSAILMMMFLCLMITTIDRLFAIKYPFIYQLITTKHCMIVIASTWLLPVLFLCISLSTDIIKEYDNKLFAILIAMALTTLTASNIIVFRLARKHIFMMKRNTRVYTAEDKKNSLTVAKSAYVCFAIVMSFVLFWFPYLVHDVLTMATIYTPCDCKLFTLLVECCALCNSGLDPILFILFNKSVKREILNILKRKCVFKRNKCRSSTTSTSNTIRI